jgi:hypothetical protein
MVSVVVIQADNRPTEEIVYLTLTRRTTIQMCDYLIKSEHIQNHYRYEYMNIEERHTKDLFPATAKIRLMSEILRTVQDDFVVFLDSDAWIQNPDYLDELIGHLAADPTKQGAFSRDPFLSRNTYINSGSFVLKVNDYNRELYAKIEHWMDEEPAYHHKWPYDQYYISEMVYQNRADLFVFHPDVLNTPNGSILRHNWWKNQKMYADLYYLLDIHTVYTRPPPFSLEAAIDDREYPNPNLYDYEWR